MAGTTPRTATTRWLCTDRGTPPPGRQRREHEPTPEVSARRRTAVGWILRGREEGNIAPVTAFDPACLHQRREEWDDPGE
ncbi:MAG TPA: hypothetical protein VFC93_21965 [Chloroflexota bacterium]|nr:hypothetical protein [Chloroflexota bacterium]